MWCALLPLRASALSVPPLPPRSHRSTRLGCWLSRRLSRRLASCRGSRRLWVPHGARGWAPAVQATFDPEIFFFVLLPPIIFYAGYDLKQVSCGLAAGGPSPSPSPARRG